DRARALAVFGDSITTDHISPAGAIKPDSPAGRYLLDRQVSRGEFNSYGSRRGNHEVMMRGTFANIRIRNRMLDNVEGGYTRYAPTSETMPIYDAAMLYKQDCRPLVVIAGKEYGTGSSRDWAAKGTVLLGVRSVIAESFERIHRSNLVGMGVLPLQFREGESAETLGLTGALLILLAYLLISAGKLTGQSTAYQVMNIVGAAGFVINGWWHGAIPSTVLNVIWMGIGSVALWKIAQRRGSST